MSLLSESLTAHASRLSESASERVTYVTGATQLTHVVAVRTQTRFEDTRADMDATITTRSISWLIKPSELKSSGTQLEPQRGDKIVTASGAVYDVMPGADDKHWEYSDPHETLYRIHTAKRV